LEQNRSLLRFDFLDANRCLNQESENGDDADGSENWRGE
jgi:hypothetical protein